MAAKLNGGWAKTRVQAQIIFSKNIFVSGLRFETTS